MQKPFRSLASSAVLGILATATAHSAGFSLYNEGSAAAIGNFAAGIAAEAADASTGWYNPAGLALIKDEQIIGGAVGVLPKVKVSGVSTYRTTIGGMPLPPYVQNFNDLSTNESAVVPSLHYAKPIGSRAAIGLSVVAPFGLSTSWSEKSPVRYAATLTDVLTINVSPQVGGLISDNLALGVGIDLQYADVTFNKVLGLPTVPITGNPRDFDSPSHNEAHSFGVGFHAGVLALFNDNHTRVGLNYQSRMRHKFHGYSRLVGPLADPAGAMATGFNFQSDTLFSNPNDLPDIITLSAYHDVMDNVALLGSIVYTGWSVFDQIELNNVAAGAPMLGTLLAKSVAVQNYKDTWRFAVGANVTVNESMMVRLGGGYDQTPTNDVDRDMRLPDADRVGFSAGLHYQVYDNASLDVGYTYLYAPDGSRVNKTEAFGSTSTYTVVANSKPSAHLIGLQGTWYIDGKAKPMMGK